MSSRLLILFVSIIFISCSSDSDLPEEEVPVVNLPTLTTTNATSVTENSAVVGGNITSDGGGQITERGVVWNSNSNPTTLDTKASIENGSGEFSTTISNLERNTQYFLRAYAINSEGIAYGNEISFTTSASLPEVTTIEVTEITENSAKSSGEIADDGGSTISTRGICWNTSPNPTIEDDTSENGEGLGTFSSELIGLEPDTEYFVRAYAENSAGISYGNEISFTTKTISLKTFEGNVVLKTQQEVDDFGMENYEVITGTLTLGDRFSGVSSDITDLSALQSLKEIGLKFDIWNNDNLIDFSGLEGLTKVGSDLEFNGNDGILNFTGFENLSILEGELIIQGNDSLEDINRLEQVIPQAKRIFIFRNDNLISLSAFSNITELNGNFRLTISQSLEDLDDFSLLEIVNGNFELMNNEALKNINGLVNLKEVNGNFIVRANGILEIIGLNDLERVVGEISIDGNNFLENINGFNGLVEIMDLSITFNSDELQINGFGSLQSVGGTLRLMGFLNNQEINAFASLNSVEKDVDIRSATIFNFNFLSSLRQVGGNLSIRDAGSLGSLNGLTNLETVGGSLEFNNTSFSYLENFPKLVEVKGSLNLKFNDQLRDVQLINLSSIGEDVLIEGNLFSLFNLDNPWGLESIGRNLVIKTNNSSPSGVGLTTLKAFENLTSVGGRIEFTNNPNLENYCDIEELISSFTGSLIINGNWFNPSQQDIIDGNCSQ